MRIVVAGTTGYIGKKFLKYVNGRYELIALYREGRTLSETDKVAGIAYVETNYSVEQLKEIFEGCDAVVNFAARKVQNGEKEGFSIYLESIMLAENIICAAEQVGIRNVVQMSSRCVYGAENPAPCSEEQQVHPINLYGIGKVACEELGNYYNRTKEMKIKSLRLSQVIGVGMPNRSAFNVFFDKIANGEDVTVYGKGIGARDYIYDKDVCKAVECAVLSEDAAGIFNIGSGVAVSNVEMAQTMIRVLGSLSQINHLYDKPEDELVMCLDMSKAKEQLNFTCTYTMEMIVQDILQER